MFAALSVLALAACGSDGSSPGGNAAAGSSGVGGTATVGSAGSENDASSGDATGSSGTGGASGAAGDGAGGAGASGSGGTGVGASGGTGGSANVPSWTEPVSHSTEGVLTNRPEFQFVSTGDFTITSAYFILLELSTSTFLYIYGDFENQGSMMRCIPVAELSVADVPIISVGNGPRYRSSTGSQYPCFPPGAAGVFDSIQMDVPATILDSPATVSYSITGVEPSDPMVPHPDEPVVLQPKIAEVDGGWGVTGIIQTTPSPIHNFAMDFFARDVSGVIFDKALAFPGDLETLPPSSQMLFESTSVKHGALVNVIDGPFGSFELYMRFLEGTSARMVPERPELQARLDLASDHRAASLALRYHSDSQRTSISSKQPGR